MFTVASMASVAPVAAGGVALGRFCARNCFESWCVRVPGCLGGSRKCCGGSHVYPAW